MVHIRRRPDLYPYRCRSPEAGLRQVESPALLVDEVEDMTAQQGAVLLASHTAASSYKS